MTCRIDRVVTAEDYVILRISGRIIGEDLNMLRVPGRSRTSQLKASRRWCIPRSSPGLKSGIPFCSIPRARAFTLWATATTVQAAHRKASIRQP